MPKILVEIVNNDLTKKKRYPYEGNKIIIRKWDKNRNSGYQPTFTKKSILYYKQYWLFLKRKVMLVDGAEKCIEFNIDDKLSTVDIPVWDRKAEERLFESNTIKASGNVNSNLKIPSLFYIAILMSAMIGLLTLLVASGRLKL